MCDPSRLRMYTHLIFSMYSLMLSSALTTVVEAFENEPGRYAIIYNIKYDNNNNIFDSSVGTTVAAIAFSLCTSAYTPKLLLQQIPRRTFRASNRVFSHPLEMVNLLGNVQQL
jgi:hypothetical protein